VLVANKSEGRHGEVGAMESYALGLGDPVQISAEHGEGLSDLYDALRVLMPDPAVEGEEFDDDDIIETDEDLAKRPIRVAIVGRPNAGKSTLTNALVGTKVAITSSKPQTTRHAIRGIVHREDAQLVLVDTPGLHKPRTLLGERLNDVVRATWAEVDVIGFCLPADQKLGPGDKYIAKELAGVRKTPKVAIITKTDLVDSKTLAEQLIAVDQLGRELGIEWAEIIPVSAVGDKQVSLLADLLVPLLPEGPMLYPEGDLTDEPEQVMVAELIREAALEGVRDELPHSIAVVVEEMIPREGRPEGKPLLDVHANIYIERPSQKGIIIGPKGARLKEVGTKSRKHIEALLGTPVFLDLHVKVAKDWQRDPKQLRKLGF
jgi:GTP-binding protein Era